MRLKILVPFALAAFWLWVLHAVSGELLLPGLFDFGRSLNAPTPEYARYLALWMLFGSLAAASLAAGLVRGLGVTAAERLAEAWNAASDRKWIVYGSIFAFLIPAALRTFLLQGAPLTDDESAYRFMAQLLASGRVYGDSPPLKLFFDNRFMINDGRLFAHFFVGWPALLVPGVLLGAPGFMNAVYSALTVPALYGVLRRLAGGSAWARAGIMLYLASPMLMLMAATELSHTSCVAALAWATWFFLRSRDEGAPWWAHAGFALSFSIAFFIRPTSALGVALPFLVVWSWKALRGAHLRRLAAFALPAVILAGLFLMVNKLQTGSVLEVAYQRAYAYAEENDFRFSLWSTPTEGGTFSELRFDSAGRSLAINGAAFFRLSISLLGWPCSIFFMFFAGFGPRQRLVWASAGAYFLLHLFTDNVGIDTFAPMHYVEAAWPLMLLNVLGLARLTSGAGALDECLPDEQRPPWRWRSAPAALAAALIVVSVTSYLPIRFGNVARLAENIRMPWQALRHAEIDRAVIFAQEPFIFYCKHPPTSGWVFARPNNDPELENDILWVNHLSVETNRLLMREHFPDRPGFVMAWGVSCRPVFLPLDAIEPGTVPDARVSGIADVGRGL